LYFEFDEVNIIILNSLRLLSLKSTFLKRRLNHSKKEDKNEEPKLHMFKSEVSKSLYQSDNC